MIELYELEFFLSCNAKEVEGKILMIDRFKVNKNKIQ